MANNKKPTNRGRTTTRNSSSGKISTRTTKSTTKSGLTKAKKKAVSRKKENMKKHPSNGTSLTMVQYEVTVLLILVMMLFVMLSVYLNTGGVLGEAIRVFMFGVFGVAGWIAPLVLFVATFYKMFNKGNERLNIKILLSIMIIFFVSVAAHIGFVEYAQIDIKLSDKRAFFASLANYYMVSSAFKVGGGFIGGLIGDVFIIFLGKIASGFLLAAIFIALLVAITEQSFIMLVRGITNVVVTSVKKLAEKMEAKYEESQMKRELKKDKAAEAKITEDLMRQQNTQETETSIELENKKKDTKESVDIVSQEAKPKKKRHIADLFKSTIFNINNDEDYDVMNYIEKKEANELNEREERFSQLFDEAEGLTQQSTNNKVEFEDEVRLTFDELHPEAVKAEDLNNAPEVTINVPKGTVSILPEIKKSKDKAITKSASQSSKPKIEQEMLEGIKEDVKVYKFPPLELLQSNNVGNKIDSRQSVAKNARKLEETLESFGVGAKVIDFSVGPSVTRYEIQPNQGVKVSKIVNLVDDIALNLAASSLRIEAPIPGKSAIGIEVPNAEVTPVFLKDVLNSEKFEKFPSKVAFALGKDISGELMIADIGRMPHLLIAGATGSGKSVCINTLITSILYKASPDEVKFLMIDPKVVELSIYNGIPHLLIPVVTDPNKAANALNWAVQEMLDRYKIFSIANVRDLKGYNKYVDEKGEMKKLPQIIIIVDELADLMAVASKNVEDAIHRLAQMARAAGIHLIIATQRPSVNVITGVIKANIPSRIAFNVASGTDSRTIIDMNGAEKLLGKGDMLFYPVGVPKPIRVQGAFISDKEIKNIVAYLKDKKKHDYDQKILKQLDKDTSEQKSEKNDSDLDDMFIEALELCVKSKKASASMIQRRFRMGYNRAGRIIDQLFDAGFIGEDQGSKGRDVLMTMEELVTYKENLQRESED